MPGDYARSTASEASVMDGGRYRSEVMQTKMPTVMAGIVSKLNLVYAFSRFNARLNEPWSFLIFSCSNMIA